MRLLKYILFSSFFLLLLSEQFFFFFPKTLVRDLKGTFVKFEKPELTADNWVKGKYQEQFLKYHEQNLALHPLLIRLRNQIGYSFYKEMNTEGIVEGKENTLYDHGYITTYLGNDFVGDSVVNKKVEMLGYVQAELKKRNIDLVFVMAPSKPAVLPEYIPKRYDLTKKTKSNYDAFTSAFEKHNINHLNITKFFLKRKGIERYPLFTKCGIHWSGYGATLAADTTFKYIENLRQIDLPDYYDAGGEKTPVPRDTDNDLGELSNLLYDIPSAEMYYPKMVFKNDASKTKPNLLIIGDSFTWTWIGFYGFIPNLFSDKTAFWYYNHEIGWSKSLNNGTLTKDLDLKKEVLSRDVIMIINTEPSLKNAGMFFIEQMYELLHKEAEKTQPSKL
ncbi:MAG: hypothetical protein H0X46_06860 [Bacteroidetes bacterium]|nr:hypothetical protein [Bacteroidota bacterium]